MYALHSAKNIRTTQNMSRTQVRDEHQGKGSQTYVLIDSRKRDFEYFRNEKFC